jgi:hypothetical protein
MANKLFAIDPVTFPDIKVSKVRNKQQYVVRLSQAGKVLAECFYSTRQAAVHKANDLYFTALGL